MKIIHYKKFLTVLFLFKFLSTFSQGTTAISKEFTFEDLERVYSESNYRIIKGDEALRNDGVLKNLILIEEREMKYRKVGLKLWESFPDDNRRYEWFRKTVMNERLSIFYWKDLKEGAKTYLYRRPYSEYQIPLEIDELRTWEGNYEKMKTEYFRFCSSFKDAKSIIEDKQLFLLKELELFLKNSLNKEYRILNDPLAKFDMNKMTSIFLSVGFILNDSTSRYHAEVLRAMDNDFLSCYQELGITFNELRNFVEAFKTSNNSALKMWAFQRSALLDLKNTPFVIKSDTIDKQFIDTTKMRGKVLLIDFWATSCLSCIERMPFIKSLYNKYHDRGFEVISACFNFGDEKKEVVSLTNKLGVTWPTLLIGGINKDEESRKKTIGGDIWEKYGFFGVPQLFLLDKEGKLVVFNDLLRNGDFEPLLIALLNN